MAERYVTKSRSMHAMHRLRRGGVNGHRRAAQKRVTWRCGTINRRLYGHIRPLPRSMRKPSRDRAESAQGSPHSPNIEALPANPLP